jgi:hypothetical protein
MEEKNTSKFTFNDWCRGDVTLEYATIVFEKIMFEKIPNIDYVPFDHWGILIEYQNLSDIQFYIKRTIKNGINDGYDFIHSPNNKFQDRRRPDYRIYGTFLWEYMNWLKLQFEKSKIQLEVNKDINKNWFKVGLAFADGRIDNLLSKHSRNYSAMARELGNESGFKPYISTSVANSRIFDKNIFSNEMHIQQIIEYCHSNNIIIVDSFHRRVLESKEIKR